MFILNTVDGCILSDLGVCTRAEVEEGRRLLYVAMTRAKDNHDDHHLYAARTRFILAKILSLFDACAWPIAASSRASPAKPLGAPVDIGAGLKRMWR